MPSLIIKKLRCMTSSLVRIWMSDIQNHFGYYVTSKLHQLTSNFKKVDVRHPLWILELDVRTHLVGIGCPIQAISKMDVRHFGCHILTMDVSYYKNGCHVSKMDVRYCKNGCQTFWMSHVANGCQTFWMSHFDNGCLLFQKWMSDISKMEVTHFKNRCQTFWMSHVENGCQTFWMSHFENGCQTFQKWMSESHFKNGCQTFQKWIKMDDWHPKLTISQSGPSKMSTCVLWSSVAMATSALPPQGARSNPAAACVMCLVASLRSPAVGGMLPGRGPPRHPSWGLDAANGVLQSVFEHFTMTWSVFQ